MTIKLFIIIFFLKVMSCSQIPTNKVDVNTKKILYKNYRSYIKSMKKNILKKNFRGTKVVNQILPFDYPPKKICENGNKKGVILIHGLWSTPYEMKSLGEFFSKNCFRSRGILLNGHGTRISELFNLNYIEWLNLISWNIDELKKEVDDVYLLGLSFGASLSVKMAMERDDIKGLFLFSPALALPWYSFVLGPSKIFMDYMKKRTEDDFYRYRSADVNGPLQVYRLGKEIEDLLEKKSLQTPVLSFLFAGDRRALDPQKVHQIMSKSFTNLKSIVYTEEDTDLNYLAGFGGKPKKIKSTMKKDKIYGQSHLSLVVPPGDSYYGEKGVYRDCEHYKESSDIFKRCKSQKLDDVIWQGEVTKKNMKKGVMRRLRYNPLWESMLKEMSLYLNKN